MPHHTRRTSLRASAAAVLALATAVATTTPAGAAAWQPAQSFAIATYDAHQVDVAGDDITDALTWTAKGMAVYTTGRAPSSVPTRRFLHEPSYLHSAQLVSSPTGGALLVWVEGETEDGTLHVVQAVREPGAMTWSEPQEVGGGVDDASLAVDSRGRYTLAVLVEGSDVYVGTRTIAEDYSGAWRTLPGTFHATDALGSMSVAPDGSAALIVYQETSGGTELLERVTTRPSHTGEWSAMRSLNRESLCCVPAGWLPPLDVVASSGGRVTVAGQGEALRLWNRSATGSWSAERLTTEQVGFVELVVGADGSTNIVYEHTDWSVEDDVSILAVRVRKPGSSTWSAESVLARSAVGFDAMDADAGSGKGLSVVWTAGVDDSPTTVLSRSRSAATGAWGSTERLGATIPVWIDGPFAPLSVARNATDHGAALFDSTNGKPVQVRLF